MLNYQEDISLLETPSVINMPVGLLFPVMDRLIQTVGVPFVDLLLRSDYCTSDITSLQGITFLKSC